MPADASSAASPSPSPSPVDAFSGAIADLRSAILDNLERNRAILARLDEFDTGLRRGASVADLSTSERSPAVVEMLSQNLAALETAGAAFRAAQARALHDDGLTMDAIADRFGVTRQRVSALLRNADRSG